MEFLLITDLDLYFEKPLVGNYLLYKHTFNRTATKIKYSSDINLGLNQAIADR